MAEEVKKEKKEKVDKPIPDLSDFKDPVIFYCKDCHEVVDTNRCGRQYVYKCKKCGTKNVAFGTPKSIFNFFRMEYKKKREDEQAQESTNLKEQREKQAAKQGEKKV